MRAAMILSGLLSAILLAGAGAVPAGPLPPAPASAAAQPAAGPAPQAPPADRQAMKIGYVAILPNAPLFIAQERGYFADQALDVEWIVFDSGAQMVAAAAAGQLDIITGVPGPGLFN